MGGGWWVVVVVGGGGGGGGGGREGAYRTYAACLLLYYYYAIRCARTRVHAPRAYLAHTWHIRGTPGGDGRLCVADFGLVRYHHSDGVAEMTAETGSYRWMAPEVIRHEPYGTGCDVYSFAVVCWEMVTYSIPFPRRSPVEVALAVANEGRRPEMPPHAPPVAARMIESCWQQDPQLRPSFQQARQSEYTRSKSTARPPARAPARPPARRCPAPPPPPTHVARRTLSHTPASTARLHGMSRGAPLTRGSPRRAARAGLQQSRRGPRGGGARGGGERREWRHV